MRKLLLPMVAMAVVSAAALLTARAEAAVSAAPESIRAAAGSLSVIEPAACWRRRVCGPRGCVWRTVCGRRW